MSLQARIPGALSASSEVVRCAPYASDRDTEEGFSPAAVVTPKRLEDVQALVKWANDASVPIVPVSSTGPRRRGDTVPQVPDCVIADLSGMQRLVHADRRDKIAIVEAGVSFGMIDDLLRPHDLRAYRPLKPRAGKSVLTSYLDREPTLVPDMQWDISDPFGGTAMVLGNGDLCKTGGAAVEGTLEEQLKRGHRQLFAAGPAHIDLVRITQGAQGSLATMVWGAIYCEPIPKVEKSFFASADSLGTLVALSRDLLDRRLCSTLFIVDGVQLAMLMGKTSGDLERLSAALPAWTAFVSLAGYQHRPEQRVEWQTKDLVACAKTHGADLSEQIAGITAETFAADLRISEDRQYQDRFLGGHKELFFLQSFSKLETVVAAGQSKLTTGPLASRKIGTYIQPMVQGTFCHIAFTMPCLPEDTGAGTPIDTQWREAIMTCDAAGAFFSRPYGDWFDLAFRDAPNAKRMMNSAKTILDPKGIMNPKRLPYEGTR
jgi:hypothetical protein